MTQRTTRRRFLKTTAMIGAGFWVAGGIAPRRSRAAIDEIGFACIGVGGKGSGDSGDAKRHGNIVAICDIDDTETGRAAQRNPEAKPYNDYRKMLEEVGKSIDAVTVSTPDHHHFPASALAMKMGKHCFTQKPLTHTIWEARRLGELAREMNVQTMMGNQGTAERGLRQAAALIKAGVLGTVKEVHVWTNRPIWPQGIDRPTDTPSVPEHVHWDQWVGPAEFRPYNPCYHPFKWRGWWAFGTGALGDMACHTLNMPFAGCGLLNPTSVVAETSGHNKETYPSWSKITFEFPANDWRPALTLYWYDGRQYPPSELLHGMRRADSGAVVVGDKGSLYSPDDYGAQFHLLGGAEMKDVEYQRSPGHFQEWINAINGEGPATSNFPDYAGPLTETILLGNLAVWADGKKIEWDAKNLKATNAPEVEHIIRKEYRAGWDFS